MDTKLSKAEWQSALVYLYDIFVCSKSVTENLVHGGTVLKLLLNARVTPKLAACSFFDDMVSYPGHTIRLGKLIVDNKNCMTVPKLLPHTNQMELQSSLRMWNEYHRFVPNFV